MGSITNETGDKIATLDDTEHHRYDLTTSEAYPTINPQDHPADTRMLVLRSSLAESNAPAHDITILSWLEDGSKFESRVNVPNGMVATHEPGDYLLLEILNEDGSTMREKSTRLPNEQDHPVGTRLLVTSIMNPETIAVTVMRWGSSVAGQGDNYVRFLFEDRNKDTWVPSENFAVVRQLDPTFANGIELTTGMIVTILTHRNGEQIGPMDVEIEQIRTTSTKRSSDMSIRPINTAHIPTALMTNLNENPWFKTLDVQILKVVRKAGKAKPKRQAEASPEVPVSNESHHGDDMLYHILELKRLALKQGMTVQVTII